MNKKAAGALAVGIGAAALYSASPPHEQRHATLQLDERGALHAAVADGPSGDGVIRLGTVKTRTHGDNGGASFTVTTRQPRPKDAERQYQLEFVGAVVMQEGETLDQVRRRVLGDRYDDVVLPEDQ